MPAMMMNCRNRLPCGTKNCGRNAAAKRIALGLVFAAVPVMRGEVNAMLRKLAEVRTFGSAAKAAPKRTGRKGVVELPVDEALLVALKASLVETVATENVATFAVLHDDVLKEIAGRKPKERSKLGDINGTSENKLRK